uniref:fimbria/pilus outer membrane usher protein n=1 Tax=Vibrio cholerae TaxID=666 RepID=UPI001C127245
TFTLAGYRYSTSGYYDFQEANEIDPGNFNDWRRTYNKRSKAQININQSLGEYGNFYINCYQQDFWRQKGYE